MSHYNQQLSYLSLSSKRGRVYICKLYYQLKALYVSTKFCAAKLVSAFMQAHTIKLSIKQK